MSLIYWENVLVGDPLVPFDISFRIMCQGEHDHGDDVDNVASVGGATALDPDSAPLIPAHKLVLGLTSPVFRTQLYGGWKEGKEQVIEVRDVTFTAFRTMVNYMYGIPLQYSAEFLTLEKARELFDIVYAAKKYLIPQLTGEIVALINKAAITTNTEEVEEMVMMAEHFSHLEEASTALLAKCEEEKENAKKEGEMIWEKENARVATVQEVVDNEDQIDVELNIDFVPMLPIIHPDPILFQFDVSNDSDDDIEVPEVMLLQILEVSNDSEDDLEAPEVMLEVMMGESDDIVYDAVELEEEERPQEENNVENDQLDDSLVNHTDQIDLGS
eukprot:GFUD01032216.1.p1 GENE.GFUD01032216.1~~GFUD01032216.1.p1  ORF type:complete len:329 (+),score=116.37 GFUD01032216.1:74-1060(+)